jgi:hypothetical protein
MFTHKIAVYPNNEIRSWIVSSHKIKALPSDSTDVPKEPDPSYLTLEQYSTGLETPAAIDSQESPQKVGYGALGRETAFSALARRTLLRAGGALQKAQPVNECLFLTMTLPGSTAASFRALAEWSGYAVQHLKNWIGWRVKSNLSLYVWEWQKRGALHLHYVVHVPCPNARQYIQENLQAQWIRILDAIVCNSGVDVYSKGAGFTHANDKSVVQTRAEVCKYSVAGYLSKYLGKNSRSTNVPSKFKFVPSRWYGVSRPLHALIEQFSQVCERTFGRQRDALKSYEDSLSLLHSQSTRHYSFRHGSTSFRTTIAYFKEAQIGAIWMTLAKTRLSAKPSSQTTDGKGSRFITEALRIMDNSEKWQTAFCSLSSPYVRTLVTRWKDSQPMSNLDREYLLDTLCYTLEYTRKTGRILTGLEARFICQARQFLTEYTETVRTPFLYRTEVNICNETIDKIG